MTWSTLPARPNPLRPATILKVQYRLLGPLEVDGVVISSPQARRLLALFLVHRNSVVSVDRIVDTLWDGNPPPAATNAALSKISRLRAFLPPGALTRAGDGYRLEVADDACDAVEFEQLVEKARNASEAPAVRNADLQRALGLFRGPALGDLAHIDAIRPSAVKLDRLREEAEELRLECLLTIGDAHAVLGASDAILADWPFRERIVRSRLLALRALGRRVEALRELHDFRARLADETGLEIGPELRAIEPALLDDGAVPPSSHGPSVPAVQGPTPMAAYSRPRARKDPTSAWRGPLASQAALLGRDDELDLLVGALADACAGEARACVIAGPAGIGKTRLTREFLQEARRRHCGVIVARGMEGVMTPFGALRGPLAALGLPVPEANEKGRPSESWLSEESFKVATQLFRFAPDQAPGTALVITLEDAHWADAGTLLVLEYLAALNSEGSNRVLMVITTRPIVGDDRRRASLARIEREEGGTRIILPPLDEPTVADLVTSLAGRRPTASLVGALVSFGGSPLLVTTALRALCGAGKLVLTEGRLAASGDPDSLVTGDVAYGVATMMEGMHDGIAEALRVAALLGEHVPIPLLSEATGWDEAMVGEVTSAAERHGLARIEGDEFVFDHDLYRWALVEQLATADRRRHHAELAHRLAAIGSGADLERTVLVARHAAAAGSAVATDLLARSALAAATGASSQDCGPRRRRIIASVWIRQVKLTHPSVAPSNFGSDKPSSATTMRPARRRRYVASSKRPEPKAIWWFGARRH